MFLLVLSIVGNAGLGAFDSRNLAAQRLLIGSCDEQSSTGAAATHANTLGPIALTAVVFRWASGLGTAMDTPPTPPPASVMASIRRKVAQQLEQHQYESAVFLADKLVTMSNGAEEVSVALSLSKSLCSRGASHRRDWEGGRRGCPARSGFTHRAPCTCRMCTPSRRRTFGLGCTSERYTPSWRRAWWSATANFGACLAFATGAPTAAPALALAALARMVARVLPGSVRCCALQFLGGEVSRGEGKLGGGTAGAWGGRCTSSRR